MITQESDRQDDQQGDGEDDDAPDGQRMHDALEHVALRRSCQGKQGA